MNYAPHLPDGVQIVAAERANRYTDNSGYDPATYLETNLFGEEDTRSSMMRLVSQTPDQDHQHPEHEGSRRHRRHRLPQEHRLRQLLERRAHPSARQVPHLLGRRPLAAIEPLRSRTVLQIMDGLRGVWHGGPFARTTNYVFYPRRILFGTDPVAIDRLLLDIIEDKRREQGAISIWDRSPASLKMDDARARDADPNVNIIIREPGHVEYARVARARRLRPGQDQGAGRHRMTPLLLALLASGPCVYWTQGVESRPALESAGDHPDLRAPRTGRCLEGGGLCRGRR